MSDRENGWVRTFDGERMQRVPLVHFKQERAPFMLEVWRYERPANQIDVYVRSFLWLVGPTPLPGKTGRIDKETPDELLKTCPYCNHVLLPPVPTFTRIDHVHRVIEPWVACLACQHRFPRKLLIDNHTFRGTIDRIGAHMGWRYEQLRRVLVRRMVDGASVSDHISAPEAADILFRVLRKDMEPIVQAVVRGERGSTDMFWKGQLVNNSEVAYIYADKLAAELSKGVPLETYFSSLLRA